MPGKIVSFIAVFDIRTSNIEFEDKEGVAKATVAAPNDRGRTLSRDACQIFARFFGWRVACPRISKNLLLTAFFSHFPPQELLGLHH